MTQPLGYTAAVGGWSATTAGVAYDPATYGAVGDGDTDDTNALQSTINAASAGKGYVQLRGLTYRITAALTVYSGTGICGTGTNYTKILQTTTTANAIFGSAVNSLVLRNLRITGPGKGVGSGSGVVLARGANNATPWLDFTDVTAELFGVDGFSAENAIVSTFNRVIGTQNGRYGINLFGQTFPGAAGTSVSLNACYGDGNTTAGVRLYNMVYCSITAGAVDNCPTGYLLDQCQDVSLAGCGSESNTMYGVCINSGYGNTVNGLWVYDNRGIGVYVTGSAKTVSITGATDNSPNGTATNFIKIDAGCRVQLFNFNNTTANSFAAGTTFALDANSFLTSPSGMYVVGGIGLESGGVAIYTPGQGLTISEGANAKMGTATLSAGTAVVATTAVGVNSRVFLTIQSPGGTPGFVRVASRVNGTSFTITSSSGSDTSVVAWLIVDPA